MALRKIPLVTDQIYHIYNRSVASQPIFKTSREYQLFIDAIEYYMFSDAKLRFSHYLRLDNELQHKALDSLYEKNKTCVDLYAFCIMPNHYHLLVRQNIDNGISNFISRLQNSSAKYLNTKFGRSGSLYLSPFSGSIIETTEQFIHVARYIHLNPLTSYVIRNSSDLRNYLWCSFGEYVGVTSRQLVKKEQLLSNFTSIANFEKFTLDRMDYQRELGKIKHLISASGVNIPRV